MKDAIFAQRSALETLYRRHVGPGDAYALIDFPDHANVGDSAIWLGETAMLRRVTGREPDYVSTWADFDAAAFRRACPAGVLFLHGGGNLGDIWIHHQRFREKVLATIRDRPLVQLPQSIHFREAARLVPFVALAAGHPDFHLYVRDRPSLELVRGDPGGRVHLAPDSAFALGPQVRRGAADRDLLLLLRTDDERAAEDRTALTALPGAMVVDWLDEGPPPPAVADETRARAFDRAASARVERGLRLISRGAGFVTDRLHGHILATLLEMPHVALDNDYGKTAAYAASWTQDCAGVHLARSAGAAIAAVRDGLASA